MTLPLLLPRLTRTASDAEAFARIVHGGQVDKAGEPYVEHLDRVMIGVLRHLDRAKSNFRWLLPPDRWDEVLQIAWLHDVIEDTPDGGKSLALEGFATPVIRAVEMLSKPKRSSQPYADWIAWLVENAPPVALLVKLADVEDNADPVRLALLPADIRARLERKYHPALERLRAAVSRIAEGDERGVRV